MSVSNILQDNLTSKKEVRKSKSNSIKNTKKIIDNIKDALTLSDQDKTDISDFSSSTNNDDKSSTYSSGKSDKEDFLNSFEYLQFEQDFKKYYVDSTKNNNGNYDNYIKSALKLITLIPPRTNFFSKKIQEISQEVNLQKIFSDNSEENKNKKLLILDLDETLIHSDLDYNLKQAQNIYNTTLYFDANEEKNIPIPLILRPGLFKFLDYVSKEFDLIVFTASDSFYADKIIDYIEKDKKYFKLRLYRNHCIFIEPGLYIKDLRIFLSYKKLEDIIIVDNSLFSFANQLNNGILVTSFFDDKNDTFLENLHDYLDFIKEEKDIREINKRSFNFEIIKEDIIRKGN